MTHLELHEALIHLETSLNEAYRHIERSVADDVTNDRLREALECLKTSKRAFDFIDNFAVITPTTH